MNTIKKLIGDELEKYVSENPGSIVITKFSAPWCGPCRVLEDVLINLDPINLGGVLLSEVDVEEDDNADVCNKYNIRNIPVLVYFKDGTEAKRSIGLVSANDITAAIKEMKES